MNRIAVCMSTYNGEKYLETQIRSIIMQDNVMLDLYIRDDGSNDKTIDIIEKYCKKYDNIYWVNRDRTNNIGVKESFLELLKYVYNVEGNYDYYAFADQDDYWLYNKLERAVSCVKNILCERGILYFSNKIIVDSELNELYVENIIYKESYIDCLFTSNAYGCTMLMDSTLVKYIIKQIPCCICYHDNWIYRVAKSIGTEIVFDKNALIKYRQHANNVAGANGRKTVRDYVKNLIIALRSQRMHIVQQQIIEINKIYCDEISASANRQIVSCILNYNSNIISKIILLANKQSLKYGFSYYVRWVYRVLFNLI